MDKQSGSSGSRWLKDWPSAVLLIVVGALVAWKGADYSIGEMRRMGPGFFPVALGVLLMLLGALLFVPSLGASSAEAGEPTPVDLRGWGCVIAGVLAFIVLGAYGGLIPATLGLVFISALGDRRNSLLTAVMVAVVMTLIAVFVFSMLLGVQFPLFLWA